MSKVKRTRVWTCIVYPDSAPGNWVEKLRAENIPFCISPMHTKTENDEEIKPHYHVVFKFSGPKTYESVQYLQQITNGTALQRCMDIRAYCRYLIHLDNPEKEQFNRDPKQIERYNGFSFGTFFEQDSFDAEENLSELFMFIADNGVTEYATLVNVLIEGGYQHFFNLATKKYTLAVRSYLTSYRNILTALGGDTSDYNEAIKDIAKKGLKNV